MVRVQTGPTSGRRRHGESPGRTGTMGYRPRTMEWSAALLAALTLAACAHTPPILTPAFPNPPVQLNAPLPQFSTLPPNANLRDVLEAHLKDVEGFQELTAEVRAWRQWYAEQAAAWPKK